MSSCHKSKDRRDWLLLSCSATILMAYALFLMRGWIPLPASVLPFAHGIYELTNAMWWGILLGMFFVGILSHIPRDFVTAILGTEQGLRGLMRATLAGLLLDLCNHGILLVGTKLYERGASLGQTMAFLIASPWNSFSLTIILYSLIGLKLTLVFIGLSGLIAIVSGLIFDRLVLAGVLPENPNRCELPADFRFWRAARKGLADAQFDRKFWRSVLHSSLNDSRMILRWILFGIVAAALIRSLINPEQLQAYFGPTLLGLGLTLIGATIIEVCSEGSTPIAADLVNQAKAPGNGFAFLMTGVATDYTEILALKETTRSWRVAFMLPLITLPQVVGLAILLNTLSQN